MNHTYLIELNDELKGYTQEVDKLEREYGCEEFNLDEHDEELKTDILERMAGLVRTFTKKWNMENSSRIPYIARDELISYLRVNIRRDNK